MLPPPRPAELTEPGGSCAPCSRGWEINTERVGGEEVTRWKEKKKFENVLLSFLLDDSKLKISGFEDVILVTDRHFVTLYTDRLIEEIIDRLIELQPCLPVNIIIQSMTDSGFLVPAWDLFSQLVHRRNIQMLQKRMNDLFELGLEF